MSTGECGDILVINKHTGARRCPSPGPPGTPKAPSGPDALLVMHGEVMQEVLACGGLPVAEAEGTEHVPWEVGKPGFEAFLQVWANYSSESLSLLIIMTPASVRHRREEGSFMEGARTRRGGA